MPRDLNERADYLSRIIDYDDCQLNPSVFSELDNCWGPHSVDRFASFHNSTVDVRTLAPRQWMPSLLTGQMRITGGVPQLAWSPELFAMHRLVEQWDPWWPSAAFWPLLCPSNTGFFAKFVREVRELPQVDSLFLPGLSGAVLFNGEAPNTKVLALRCNFSGESNGELIPC